MGAVLTYEVANKRSVRRSETDIFRQINHGLVLLLIGKMNDDGLPTASRILVTGSYSPDQELSQTGELIGTHLSPTPDATLVSTPTVLPPRFTSVDVQIISITQADGQIMTQFRLYNGGMETLHIVPDDIWLAIRYTALPAGPGVPVNGISDFNLLPGQAIDLTIIWLWGQEPFGILGIAEFRFAVNITR